MTKAGIKVPNTKTRVVTDDKTVLEEASAALNKEKEAPVKAKAVIPKKYESDDMIRTRSVTQGEMLLPGKKSGILYRWSNFGDITEVEYQDLYALKSSRSFYLYSPLFVIEDEELLEDNRWKDLKTLYDSMYNTEDLNAILKLPVAQLKKVLTEMPSGFLNAIKIEVATRMEKGTFDSISKIRVIDAICGTDFISMI